MVPGRNNYFPQYLTLLDYSGEIRLGGKNDHVKEKTYKEIGYCLKSAVLCQNLRFWAGPLFEKTRQRNRHRRGQGKITDLDGKTPSKGKWPINQETSQKEPTKVQLIITLIQGLEVIILDEPFSNGSVSLGCKRVIFEEKEAWAAIIFSDTSWPMSKEDRMMISQWSVMVRCAFKGQSRGQPIAMARLVCFVPLTLARIETSDPGQHDKQVLGSWSWMMRQLNQKYLTAWPRSPVTTDHQAPTIDRIFLSLDGSRSMKQMFVVMKETISDKWIMEFPLHGLESLPLLGLKALESVIWP